MSNSPDIIACVVGHLRADSGAGGVATLLGSTTRINDEFIEDARSLTPTLPQAYCNTNSGQPVSSASGIRRVNIWVEAKTRNLCEQIHARLWTLFHDKSNYTLGATPNSTFVVRSERATPPDPQRDTANASYDAQATYEFLVTEPF